MSTWQLSLFAGLLALVVRAFVAQGPYSGMGVAPLFGDFEAQRHWMEITANLPVNEWYAGKHQDNNLTYWGMDYPPLTAYHSLGFGHVFAWLCPEMVELGKSRGIETYRVKIWMRFSALLSDALVFIPSIILFATWQRRKMEVGKPFLAFLLTALLSPSLILIDHGHFQFNCVCHGLVIVALAFAMKRRLTFVDSIVISIAFCLALNFKQMALYYALAFFVFLLKWAVAEAENYLSVFIRLLILASAVIVTFCVLWLPLVRSPGDVVQILRRIFPFERGIFEDKVANFWGVSNVLIKWKLVLTPAQLKLGSAAATLLSTMPFLVNIWRNRIDLLICLFGTSLAFFLFAFQVHEKSILLPVVPAMLLPGGRRWDWFKLAFALASSFSLFPLFFKDGIVFTALVLNLFYFCLVGVHLMELSVERLAGVAVMCFGFCVTSFLVVFVRSPFPSLPDLFVVLHNTYSFVVLVAFYVVAFSTRNKTKEE